ncbi:MFS transporter [Sphingobium algorifonticola]|uniref:MFS transporter n=1 Tax=Sphingobium algorifonticola TaxID=2008318 RepID=A0A437J8V6_9SPHN|nr:MFS transporter [Sphingobium algorifonticola]RVT41941.1 MFS transporter [Sphingobium algorifonticola]
MRSYGKARGATTDQPTERIGWSVMLSYSGSAFAAGYLCILVNTYVMKFSTDVLLIAPAVMGLIFGFSRIWDAVSDPIAGYLSDRTSLAFGRRRSWILASIIPVVVTFYMVFAPPALDTFGLTVWMAVAIIGFYTAMTVFLIPHMSLGAEIAPNYLERNRVFGYRHSFYTAGGILSLGAMYILIAAGEAGGPDLIRLRAPQLAIVAACGAVVLFVWLVWTVKERADGTGRAVPRPTKAFGDVLKNQHARRLLIITFIEQMGSAAVVVTALYMTQYVVGVSWLAPILILAFMAPSAASVPLWLWLSKRYGKMSAWVGAMLLTAVAFASAFSIAFMDDLHTRVMMILATALISGFAAGAGGTYSPSTQGDVIDYDEYITGDRKEGAYFAAWNLAYKTAYGVMLFLTGFALDFGGFVPNQDQSMTSKIVIAGLFSLLPAACNIVGAYLLTRFTLDEQECNIIKAHLAQRPRDWRPERPAS